MAINFGKDCQGTENIRLERKAVDDDNIPEGKIKEAIHDNA